MQANGVPIPASNRLQPDAATGNLADPQKIVRQASPALSRGNLLATSFPLKEDAKSERDIFVKETLSTQSKDVLVGWAKGAKEAVATEHAVSEAPRGRSWTALGDCDSKPWAFARSDGTSSSSEDRFVPTHAEPRASPAIKTVGPSALSGHI